MTSTYTYVIYLWRMWPLRGPFCDPFPAWYSVTSLCVHTLAHLLSIWDLWLVTYPCDFCVPCDPSLASQFSVASLVHVSSVWPLCNLRMSCVWPSSALRASRRCRRELAAVMCAFLLSPAGLCLPPQSGPTSQAGYDYGTLPMTGPRPSLDAHRPRQCYLISMTPDTWAEKFEGLERVYSISETQPLKRLVSWVNSNIGFFHLSNLSVLNFRFFWSCIRGSLHSLLCDTADTVSVGNAATARVYLHDNFPPHTYAYTPAMSHICCPEVEYIGKHVTSFNPRPAGGGGRFCPPLEYSR